MLMKLTDWMRFTRAAVLRRHLHFMFGCKAARVDLVKDLMKKGMIK